MLLNDLVFNTNWNDDNFQRNVSYAEKKFNQLFPEDVHKIKTYHLDLADWPSIQQFAQNVK